MYPNLGEIILVGDKQNGKKKEGVWVCTGCTDPGELTRIPIRGKEDLYFSRIVCFISPQDYFETCPEKLLTVMTGYSVQEVKAMPMLNHFRLLERMLTS